jgi:hypothetical protein
MGGFLSGMLDELPPRCRQATGGLGRAEKSDDRSAEECAPAGNKHNFDILPSNFWRRKARFLKLMNPKNFSSLV